MKKAKYRSQAKAAFSSRAMRTNVVLDERLVAQVKRLSGAKTTREAVQLALEHYARSRDYARVLALYGTGGISDGYDPKSSSPS